MFMLYRLTLLLMIQSAYISGAADFHNECRSLDTPYRGETVISGLNVGDNTTFSCLDGWFYTGSTTRTCLPSGEWSGSPGKCIGQNDCKVPRDMGYSTYFPAHLRDEPKKFKVMCHEGYENVGSEILSCVDLDPSGNAPDNCQAKALERCKEVHLGPHLNADYDVFATTWGVRLYCDQGYNIEGVETIVCHEDGTWDPTDTKCLSDKTAPIPCQVPKLPDNVKARREEIGGVSSLFIFCQQGYTLSGTERAFCLANGTWTSLNSRCVQYPTEDPQSSSETTWATTCGIAVTVVVVVCAIISYRAYRRRQTQPRVEQELGAVSAGQTQQALGAAEPGNIHTNPLTLLNDGNRSTVEELLIGEDQLTVGHIIFQGIYTVIRHGHFKSINNRALLPVALKSLKDGIQDYDLGLNNFIWEATVMKDFNHANILKIHGICIISNKIHAVLPYLANGSVKEYIDKVPFELEQRFAMTLDIAEGMRYLEKHKFVHRDLAARTCMLDDSLRVLIGGFAMSKDLYSMEYYASSDTSPTLPVRWLAPECLEKAMYSSKSDVWAYGITSWEIYSSGALPYEQLEQSDILDCLKRGGRLGKPGQCPYMVFNEIMKCWKEDPKVRPSFMELAHNLKAIQKSTLVLAKMKTSMAQAGITCSSGKLALAQSSIPSYVVTSQASPPVLQGLPIAVEGGTAFLQLQSYPQQGACNVLPSQTTSPAVSLSTLSGPATYMDMSRNLSLGSILGSDSLQGLSDISTLIPEPPQTYMNWSPSVSDESNKTTPASGAVTATAGSTSDLVATSAIMQNNLQKPDRDNQSSEPLGPYDMAPPLPLKMSRRVVEWRGIP